MQVYAHSLDLTAANYQYSIVTFAISLPHACSTPSTLVFEYLASDDTVKVCDYTSSQTIRSN